MSAGEFLKIHFRKHDDNRVAERSYAYIPPATLRSDTPTFGVMLSGVILITSGLCILPALALGPIADGLS